MIDNETKDLVKKLFNELLDLETNKKEISKEIADVLKKKDEYQELLKQKKEIDKKLKEFEEIILSEQVSSKQSITENIKMIKEDISEKLDCKVKIVNSIFKYYKSKYTYNDDELQSIIDKFVEVFETEDEIKK